MVLLVSMYTVPCWFVPKQRVVLFLRRVHGRQLRGRHGSFCLSCVLSRPVRWLFIGHHMQRVFAWQNRCVNAFCLVYFVQWRFLCECCWIVLLRALLARHIHC